MAIKNQRVRLVCISDTHGMHERISGKLPEGDILIHAGDLLGHGTVEELVDVNDWLAQQPHPHKIVIAGNHDAAFQTTPEDARTALTSATYLEDSGIDILGLTFWGSPWTPRFMNWYFMLQPGEEAQCWDKIPDDVDVLITHGPPKRILDEVPDPFERYRITHVGCPVLLDAITRKVQPALNVFGHIHEAYGHRQRTQTLYVNASTCTARYRPDNPPMVVDMIRTDKGWRAELAEL